MDFLYDREAGVLLAEAENRIRNLMWTVSGDYALDVKLDLASFSRSKYISMYDAVKQGAFARFFDRGELSMYLVKKVYYGADEQSLTDLAQLCVDAASYQKVVAERPGVPEIRQKAFSDLLDDSFQRMSASLPGRLKIVLLRGSVTGDWSCEQTLKMAVQRIKGLEQADNTMEIIQAVDELYNTLIDRSFVRKHGDLQHVLDVTLEELREFDWGDFLEEELTEDLLEQYLSRMDRQVVSLEEERDEKEKQNSKTGLKVTRITEEAAAKMYSYIELNYGRSYLAKVAQN